MPMAVEITSSASTNMKKIFDLCDKNGDGLIKREDFKSIGGERFDEDQVEKLLELMDPCNSGSISFLMFCRGVETFLLETDFVQRSESSTSTSSCPSDYSHDRSASASELTSDKDVEETISSDDIYPVTPHGGMNMSNGYLSTGSPRQRSTSSSPGVTKESPTLIARHLLMTRHQQHLNLDSPSQGSTPAEMAEEEVTKLSVEVSELNSRLQELETDQKDQEGYRTRLKRENKELKQRLEEYEDIIRSYEQNQEQLLKESEAKLRSTKTMLRVQSEKNITELNNKLAVAVEEESKCKDREATLRLQVVHLQEKVGLKESEVEEMAERQEAVQLELQRARDELRVERAKWKEEMDALTQLLHEKEEQVGHLQAECEDMRLDHRETTITASDMDGEVNRLKKLLEEAKKRNEEWEAQFLRQGQTLVKSNVTVASLSLEAEIENVSKDEVMDKLKESEEMAQRLQNYLDTLLCRIMTHHPDLLEKR